MTKNELEHGFHVKRGEKRREERGREGKRGEEKGREGKGREVNKVATRCHVIK